MNGQLLQTRRQLIAYPAVLLLLEQCDRTGFYMFQPDVEDKG